MEPRHQTLKRIEFYSVPFQGHATPLLKMIEILSAAKSKFIFDMTYISSQFFVDKKRGQYKDIKMVGIDDDMTDKKISHLSKTIPNKQFLKYFFKIHKTFFQQKTNHPDLIICDIFSDQCFRYALKHNIKYIINCLTSYGCIREALGFPNFSRSVGIAGFTILYPLFPSPFIFQGFDHLDQTRYNNRMFINSAPGFQNALTMPPNHTFTGFLARSQTQRQPIDAELLSWINNWKKKGKNKFVYISFGSILRLGQQFANKIKKAVQAAEYPTIWSLRGAFVDQFCSDYIYHRKWLPQQAILSLKEIKCYISHCGWGSVSEAISKQIPLICVPSFGDQAYNAMLAAQRKIGVLLFTPQAMGPPVPFQPDIKEQLIIKSLAAVVQDETYKKNIQRINAICRSYNAERIVSEVVENTLEFGYEHLIDKKHQDSIQTVESTLKWLLILFLIVLIYLLGNYIFKLF